MGSPEDSVPQQDPQHEAQALPAVVQPVTRYPEPPHSFWATITRQTVTDWALAYVTFGYATLLLVEMLSGALEWPLARMPVRRGRRATAQVSSAELVAEVLRGAYHQLNEFTGELIGAVRPGRTFAGFAPESEGRRRTINHCHAQGERHVSLREIGAQHDAARGLRACGLQLRADTV